MNRETIQAQQKESAASNTITPNSIISSKESSPNYVPSLKWSNLKYGLLMIAIIVVPLLIPGTSTRMLIMGYMFTVVGIYAAMAIVVAVRTYSTMKTPKRGKISINYR